jgi:hypothetical protein
MYSGPQHPVLLEMQVLARQERFRREAARDRILRQARAGRAPRVPRLSPVVQPAPTALAGALRVGSLLRRAFDALLRGVAARPRTPDPEYQTG